MKSSRQHSIFDIPDFLCNAGGVTISYFEQRPERHELLLDEGRSAGDDWITKMTNAFHGVLEMAMKEEVYMRDAAYMVAIDRVVKAMQLRGWV